MTPPWTAPMRSLLPLPLLLAGLCAGALVLAGCGSPSGRTQGGAAVPQAAGDRRGGRLVAALGSEAQTFNPAVATDASSLAVIAAMNADLIHIDRQDQRTKPALAERWTADPDGRRYTLVLRPGLRFSDGHPATADDVVFSFQVYLDEKLQSPQRDLLIVGGQPVAGEPDRRPHRGAPAGGALRRRRAAVRQLLHPAAPPAGGAPSGPAPWTRRGGSTARRARWPVSAPSGCASAARASGWCWSATPSIGRRTRRARRCRISTSWCSCRCRRPRSSASRRGRSTSSTA